MSSMLSAGDHPGNQRGHLQPRVRAHDLNELKATVEHPPFDPAARAPCQDAAASHEQYSRLAVSPPMMEV